MSTKLRLVRVTESPLNDQGLQALTSFPLITILALDDTSVTDRGMICIKTFHNLVDLRLRKTIIGDAGIQHLSELRELQALSLQGTRVTNAGLSALEQLHELSSLGLAELQIDDKADWMSLCSSWPNLEYLNLADTQLVSSDFLLGLKACPKLRGIAVPGGDDLVKAIAGMPHLRNLESLSLKPSTVSDAGIDSLASMKLTTFRTWGGTGACRNVSRLRSLGDLGLSGASFNDDTLKAIPESLQLHTLWLGAPSVTDRGLEHLAACHTLKLLTIDDTPRVSREAVNKLALALPACQIKHNGQPVTPIEFSDDTDL